MLEMGNSYKEKNLQWENSLLEEDNLKRRNILEKKDMKLEIS